MAPTKKRVKAQKIEKVDKPSSKVSAPETSGKNSNGDNTSSVQKSLESKLKIAKVSPLTYLVVLHIVNNVLTVSIDPTDHGRWSLFSHMVSARPSEKIKTLYNANVNTRSTKHALRWTCLKIMSLWPSGPS